MGLTPEEAEELRLLEAIEAEERDRAEGESKLLTYRRQVDRPAPKARPFSLYRATVGALRDAAQGVIDTVDDLGDWLGNRTGIGGLAFGSDASNGVVEYLPYQEFTRRGQNNLTDTQLPQLEGSDRAGTAESVVRGIGSFLVPYAGWAKAVGVARATTFLGRAGRGLVAGGITDFSQVDPVSGNIANVLRDTVGLESSVLDALAAEEDDSALETRLKAAMAGAPLGLAADGLFEFASRGVKAYRAWKGTAEEAQEAVRAAREGVSLDPKARDLPAAPTADEAASRSAAPEDATFREEPSREFNPETDIRMDRPVSDFEDVLDFLKRKADDPEIDAGMLSRFADNLLFGDPENALAKLGIDPVKLDFSKFDDPDTLGRFQKGLAEIYETLASKLGRSNIRVTEAATIRAAQALATAPDVLKDLYGNTTNLAETLTAARLFTGAHAHKLMAAADAARAEIVAGGTGEKWAQFLEAFHRHAYYLGALRGAGSEVGRALRSLQTVARVGKAQASRTVQDALDNEALAQAAVPGRLTIPQGASAYADRLVTDAEKIEALNRLKQLGGDVGELSREVRKQNGSILQRVDLALKETMGNLFSLSTATYNVLSGGVTLGLNTTSRALGAVGRLALSPLSGQNAQAARVALMDTWGYLEGITGGFREAYANTILLLEREGLSEAALNLDTLGLGKLARVAAQGSGVANDTLRGVNFERADTVSYRNFAVSPAEQRALQQRIAELGGPRFFEESLKATVRVLSGAVNAAGSLSRLGTILFINLPDQFVGTLAARAGAYSQAVRLAAGEAAELGLEGRELSGYLKARTIQLVGNGTPGWSPEGFDAGVRESVMAHGDAEARAVLFQDELELGFNRYLARALGQTPGMHFFVPFVRTPLRILERTALDYTPLGLFKDRLRKAILAGGPQGDEAIARIGLGMMAAITAYQLAEDRSIVGADGSYGSSARLSRPSYSLRVGDDVYEFSRIDPIGTLLGIGADLRAYADNHEMDPDGGEGFAAAVEASVYALAANMLSKTWLSSLRNLVELSGATSDEELSTRLNLYLSTFGNRLVPASGIQRQLEYANEGVFREAIGIADGFLRATIGADKLPPKRDELLGRPAELSGLNRIAGLRAGVGPNEVDDPLIAELERLSFDLPRARRKIEGVALTSSQFSRWLELKGQVVRNEDTGLTLEETLRELIELPEYATLTRRERIDAIRLELEGFSRLATDQLIREDDAFALAVLREEVFLQAERDGLSREDADSEAARLAMELGLR